jgi:hypothetical protein
MREAARWSVLVVVAVSMWAVPLGAAAIGWTAAPGVSLVATVDTTPDPTVPDTTAPEATTATTEPDDSTPEDSTPGESVADLPGDDNLVGAGDPDSDINTTTATIAVVGFILLVAIASWWMVRRTDPDARPMPRQPPSDLI